METVNRQGASPLSKPVFVYVGYSIPKQAIVRLEAEATSSTSIKVRWDKWKHSEEDVISGYRVRYAPLLSTLSAEVLSEAEGGESTEEVVITENNEITLTDLRKYTEYQVNSQLALSYLASALDICVRLQSRRRGTADGVSSAHSGRRSWASWGPRVP